MVHFQTKPPSFGTFRKAFEWKIFVIIYDRLAYFVAVCFILWQFGYILWSLLHCLHFGVLCQEKSGNPAGDDRLQQVSTGHPSTNQ
jgi:hypothetical protein